MKKLLYLIVVLLLAAPAFPQQQLNNSLGNLKNVKSNKPKQTFSFVTDNGTAEVTIYTPNIIRVRIAKTFDADVSYAVVGKVVRDDFDYGEDKHQYFISTDSMQLVIDKNPLRFTFKTKGGRIISQDDPAFGTSWIGTEVTTYKVLQEGEKFIGLGEKAGNLDRRGEAYTNWNTDNPHYDNNSDPLYASIPFYIGLHHQLRYGILLDNSYRTVFNFGASNDRFSYFSAEDGEMDYYFIWHTHVADILKSYTWLTGRMEMPPLWSLGFQQSRWSYTPDTQVLNIARTFREKNIPADVIYLDIDFMDDYKIFTWNPETFSDPAGLLKQLRDMNFRTAIIVDPGIKVEKGYKAYDEGVANNYFVKYPDGKFWTAQVWPGWCHFPDFTSERVRTWWGMKFKENVDYGIEGFWNDMNEIATWGQQPPHLIQFHWEGNKATYRQAKNVYANNMARATLEGTKKLMNGRRPLNVTRAGFAGLQRYTAIWTGDNQANDEHMLLGVRLVNSLGLSGISFTGSDVGGFGGNPTPELYARWTQIGAFTPFFRGHTAKNTASSEPWVYGEETERIARNYIQLRYNLLPYLYTAMHQSTLDGMPVNRSLAIDYTDDEKVFWRIYQNQFLFGPSMLIIPTESTRLATGAYLPKGGWYDFYSDKYFDGNQEIYAASPVDRLPVFVKEGSMIPMQSPVMFTDQKPSDTLMVHLYRSRDSRDVSWDYYEDDGVTYQYQEGKFYQRKMIYKPEINEVVFGEKSGNYESKFTYIQLVFHGFDDPEMMVKLEGKPRRNQPTAFDFGRAAEKIAPAGAALSGLPSVVIPNENGKMVVSW